MDLVLGILGSIIATTIVALVVYGRSRLSRSRFLRKLLGSGKVLLLGMSHSGKTTFIYHLLYRANPEIDQHAKTYRMTEYVLLSNTRGVSSADLRIIDCPGVLSIETQLENMPRLKPEVIFVFLAADDSESTTWFKNFCIEFSDHLFANSSGAERLRRMIVVLNKADLQSTEAVEKTVHELIHIAHEELRPLLGQNARGVVVLPCSLISQRDVEGWLKRLLRYFQGSKYQGLMLKQA